MGKAKFLRGRYVVYTMRWPNHYRRSTKQAYKYPTLWVIEEEPDPWMFENPDEKAPGWNQFPEANTATFNDNHGDGFGAQDTGITDAFGQVNLENGGVASTGGCRNCGQEGHFARECMEPRKMGACFNCGEEGHSKADCPNPRKFKGECRNCGKEGHMSANCPTRVDKCKNCLEEGHVANDCKNPKVLDTSHIADKSEMEAWELLKQASDEVDIPDFKEALQILSKACPDYTYVQLETEFRKRSYSIYLIAMKNDHGDAYTNVNLQGETDKKYGVNYFTADKPMRPTLQANWPANAEENLARLADAGVPLDRGLDRCHNCGKYGHKSNACLEEKVVHEPVTVTCFLCGETGHRVRDCTQERQRGGRACKICESEDHFARDCPNREKRTCRNCGEEDHIAKDCPNPSTAPKRGCFNCGEEGHLSRDCANHKKEGEGTGRPRKDWSQVVCNICQQKGHGRARCPQVTGDGDMSGGKENAIPENVGEGWEVSDHAVNSAPQDWEQGGAHVEAGW